MKIERSTVVTLTGTTISVKELLDILGQENPSSVVRVDYHQGMDQRDTSYVTLRIDHK